MRALLPLLSVLPCASGYCNAMHWPARSSRAFPPGWNGLSKTPVRGWRSWYAYYTAMDQAMIEGVIDALTAKNRTVRGWDGPVSLCDLGYCMVGIDEGWEGCGLGVNGTQHFLNGTPATNLKLFPDMRGLVARGHAEGLKMGWYFNGCGCMERTEPASGWAVDYEGDVRALHELGFDGVKFDGCGRLCNLTSYAELMQQTGRSFEIENCHWGACTADDSSSCPTGDWCPFNWFRTSGDSDNRLGTWYRNLQTTTRFSSWQGAVSQPGCWAYPDMLQVGRLGCGGHTSGCAAPQLANWTRAHFGAFCIASSPLVLSFHPSDANLAPILDIIGSKRALEVNQAWAGHPGSLLRTLPPAPAPVRPVAAGPVVVGDACSAADGTELGWTYEAQRHEVRRGGLCLSSDGWELPLQLYACGNASTHQNWTHDATSGLFHTTSPAPRKLFPACLQLCLQEAGSGVDPQAAAPVKADAFKCDPRSPNQQFDVDGPSGVIRLRRGSWCLAARDGFTPTPAGVAGVQLWAKPLGAGRAAALLINGGGLPYEASLALSELNLTGRVAASDVWTADDAGPVVDGVFDFGSVPPLDSRFVIFEPAP